MKTNFTSVCSLLFLLCPFFFLQAQGTSEDLKVQLSEIMTMWPGTYNNSKQIDSVLNKGGDVWRLDDSGKDGYLHVQSHYIALDVPEIGEHVLYVEEYRDLKPEATYRQRIYTLDMDSTGTQLRVKMWPFKDKKKYVGAWNDPKLLAMITKEDISAYPDICDLLVEKTEKGYLMSMNGSDCTFGTKTFNYQVLLTKDVFSYRDKITNAETNEVISTAANYVFHNLDRIE